MLLLNITSDLKGVAPSSFPQTTGRSALSYESETGAVEASCTPTCCLASSHAAVKHHFRSEGSCTLIFPADNGTLCVELRVRNWSGRGELHAYVLPGEQPCCC